MKKELPPWTLAVIGVLAVAALGLIGFMTLGQPASGPGPNAKDLPHLTADKRQQFMQNESKPPGDDKGRPTSGMGRPNSSSGRPANGGLSR